MTATRAARWFGTRVMPIVSLLLATCAGLSPAGGRGVEAQQSPCDVHVAKVAQPSTAVLHREVAVTLRVTADCPPQQIPMHAVLVVDSSTDMGGRRMADLRNAVAAFVDANRMPPSKVGLVAYAGAVEILSEMTADSDAVKEAAERFFPRRGSNLLGAMASGHEVLRRGRGGSDGEVLEVVIVVSGSEPEDEPDRLVSGAGSLKADGVLVVTVAATGFADAATLERMASSSAQFYVEGQGSRYASLMEEIAGAVSTVHLTSAQVADELSDAFAYVWGSGAPAPRMAGSRLMWSYASWPAEGITITYGVEPNTLGSHAVSTGAEVLLRLDRGQPILRPFPNPVIDVIPEPTPTSTPKPSATPDLLTATSPPPTATPTPRPGRAFLPVLMRRHCAAAGTADVVFVIDTSYSMMNRAHAGMVKLEIVQIAVTDLVWALEASGHRAAVVTFAVDGMVRQELTTDRIDVEIALSRVYDAVADGNRLDLGLRAALNQLIGPVANADSLPVVVVVTDGFEDPATAARVAADLRDVGVVVYGMGFGPGVTRSELTALTGAAARAHDVNDGASLVGDLVDVGQAIDCAVRQAR